MKKLLPISIAATTVILAGCAADVEDNHVTAQTAVHQGEMGFPEFVQPEIKGAPKLQKPFQVMGATQPILTEKHGLIAPALWDWDGDGKHDLLVGEFETGGVKLKEKGSTIRVYKNVGTNSAPEFTDSWEYARDTEGNAMVVNQWCCIGFTPQFVDLNNDGQLDMITGQYHPGHVTWFRGSKDGFLPGVKLEQEGNPESADSGLPATDIKSFNYWYYSSASFGDFDDDGDYDLIVGGRGIRISENIGTKEQPKFARRELLLDINGEPLATKKLTAKDIARHEAAGEVPVVGSSKTQQVVTDWDGDGVLDIISTDSYRSDKSMAVTFFRGVKTKEGHGFEPGIDLLKTADGTKALPGSGNRIYVADWNSDGVNDLLVGASVATVNGGEFSDQLSWEWEDVTGVESAGKDPGRQAPSAHEKPTFESMKALLGHLSDEQINTMLPMQVKAWEKGAGRLYKEGKGDWLTMRHQGRLYVFLGENTGTKAVAANVVDTKAVKVAKKKRKKAKRTPPVQFAMVPAIATSAGGTVDLTVSVDVLNGWYIYAPTGRNEPNGMIETRVSFDLPEGFEVASDMVLPPHHPKGMFEIYDGKGIKLTQPVKIASSVEAGEYTVEGQLRYQTCNKEMCLPPRTEKFTTVVIVK